MQVVIVSPYPPRHSGIATFAADVRASLLPHADAVTVVASLVGEEAPDAELLGGFRQDVQADYAPAATRINDSGADVVLIQHEFDVYGGHDGEYLLDLAHALTVPYCVALHTVHAHPSPGQAEVIRELCAGAQKVFVFSPRSRRLLSNSALVNPGKVAVVPHGAPPELIDPPADLDAGARLSEMVGRDLYGRRVLSTFGLLSPDKGLRHVIDALPEVVEDAPDVMYVVAGATRPEVREQFGETYRHELEALVQERGLGDHVAFVNRFLDERELICLLRGSQIFVTPFSGVEQVVSGTLTYAIAAGCAVVSTPYYHAQDLADTGAILLADFDDSASFSRGLKRLLGNPSAMASTRRAASALAEKLSWRAVGLQMAGLLHDAADRGAASA